MASDKFIAPENTSSSNGSTGFFTDAQLANFSQEQLIALVKIAMSSQNKLQAKVEKQEAEIDHLNEMVKLYAGMLFGTSSEKGISKKFQVEGQLSFVENAANELEITAAQQDGSQKADVTHVNGYDRPTHGTKPKGKKESDLSAIEDQIEVNDALPDEMLKKEFPNGYSVMVKGTYSVVDVIPAHPVRVIHHVLSYKSKGDDKKILTAPHDATLLNNSIVTPSYIAAAVNAKFGNYIPLNHYQKILQYMKVFVSTHDLCNQLIAVGERYCQGLYDRMIVHLHDARVLNVDETPCVVRHVEDNKDKKKKRSKCYTWVYRTGKFESGPPIVVFKFEKSRAACNPRAFLADFHDKVCVTDGLSDYHTLDGERADLTFAGCWVHARRKFTDALKVSKAGPNQTIAGEAVEKIDEIFRQERELKDLSPEERLQKRQQNIRPLVDDFFTWVKGIQNQVLSSSKTGEAIGYAKNQEQFLRVFLTDGQVPADNNFAELGCRSYVLGRKNWYVIDTPRGADMTALYYSLTETAKLNHLNPYKWYTYFLTEMMHHRDKLNDPDFLDSLLPWSDSLPDDIKVPAEPEPVPVEKKTKGHKAHKLNRPIEEITASES